MPKLLIATVALLVSGALPAVAQAEAPPWGLDRIDQRTLPLDGVYDVNGTGPNVTVYVLDTGIRATHQDFGGRVSGGYDFVDNDTDPNDPNGNGTFMAGIVGGRIHGVAKAVHLVPVRVLGANGGGTQQSIIAGINWVTKNARKPAVATISFGGLADDKIDSAVRELIASGVTVTVAAGNSGGDVASFSPARVREAITTSSSDRTDAVPTRANHGPGVDLYAPGVAITSTGSASDTATLTVNTGAAAHAAGAAALFLARAPRATPAQVSRFLMATATVGQLTGVPTDTANRLVYVN